MAFGQALSRSLTVDALHEAIWRHLPALAPDADDLDAGPARQRVGARDRSRAGTLASGGD